MASRQFTVASAEGTHAGHVRTKNEDACLSRPEVGLWVVADGMGGHQEGALASSHIIEKLRTISPADDIDGLGAEVEHQLNEGNSWLFEEAARRGAGTTIGSTVVALLTCDLSFACFWSGDSRLY